jgi:hypothetical protein
MQLVPLLAVLSLGVLALGLMTAAFLTAARSPRFPDAPPGTPHPATLPRRLMLAGATLGVAFGLLALLPGVLPWVSSPTEYVNLLLAAAGGAAFGVIHLHAVRRVTAG